MYNMCSKVNDIYTYIRRVSFEALTYDVAHSLQTSFAHTPATYTLPHTHLSSLLRTHTDMQHDKHFTLHTITHSHTRVHTVLKARFTPPAPAHTRTHLIAAVHRTAGLPTPPPAPPAARPGTNPEANPAVAFGATANT